jgi:hypothetical protein
VELALFIRYNRKKQQVVIRRDLYENRVWEETALTFREFTDLYGSILANRLKKSLLLRVSIVINE